MSVTIRPLDHDGLLRFGEIDRSEEVRTHFRQSGKALFPEPVHDSVPNFFAEGDHHSIPELVRTWQPIVDAGGVLLGAFDLDRLTGIALLGTEVAEGVFQLPLLYVDRRFKRRGIAGDLMDVVEGLARDRRARALYVSAVPTDSAVGFYLSRGFEPADPVPELFALEPDDIHMLMLLAADRDTNFGTSGPGRRILSGFQETGFSPYSAS